ncbi:MAG: YfhO family protein [Chloroflexi bacterium]|nr:YfhO family protein [Chloroflexota bacterium]
MAIGSLALLPFTFFYAVTLGGEVFEATDMVYLMFPFRAELARALAEGHLPLWTPGIEAGFPLLAEGQVAALYPLNLLLYRFLPALTALSLGVLIHLAWGAIGMYALARALGLRVTSAWLAGFVFAFNGFLIGHIPHAAILSVSAWLPWLMVLQFQFTRALDPFRRDAACWFALLAAGLACSILGGSPQMALINLIGVTCWAIFGAVVWTDAGKSRRAKSSVRIALFNLAAIGLGVAIAAVQLLPTGELIQHSLRVGLADKSFFLFDSLSLANLTQLLAPFSEWTELDLLSLERRVYLGIAPLVLGFLAPLLRRDAHTWAFFLFGLLGLGLALGGNNPLYPLLFKVPVLNLFRFPARYLLLFTFAFAYLAAVGFEELQNRARNSRGTWTFHWLIGALGFLALIIVGDALPTEFWLQAWRALPFLLAISVGGLVWLAWRRILTRSFLRVTFIAIVILDLFAYIFPLRATLAATGAALWDQTPRTVRAMDSSQTIYRVFTDRFDSATPAATRAALWPNLSLAYGKQGIKAYTPLSLQRNEDYFATLNRTLFNLLNIRYYLLPVEMTANAASPLDETAPAWGLSLDLLSEGAAIPPTRATQIEIISYTDQTADRPNGFRAGAIELTFQDSRTQTFPLRVGVETADWAYDALLTTGKVAHDQPDDSVAFPAFLSSLGREFQGHKYIARLPLANPENIVGVRVEPNLPGAGFMIERVVFIDEESRAISLAELLNRNDLTLVFRSHTAAMWENRNAFPRAFLAHRAEIVADDRALARMRQGDFDPTRLVLLNEGEAMDGLPSTTNEVTITEYEPEHVTLRVETDQPGYLILADSWYPGWEATVDGKPAPIYRADYIFRAVALEPGEHEVVFEYRPASFAIGAAISAASLILCLVIGIAGFRK